MQCADTYCVESCLYDALSRDPETGAVLVDEKACTACEACIAACPVGGISLDKEKNIVFKCDLCGGDPECVKFCSRDALTLIETDITAPERKSFMLETEKLLA
jgi:Fe-S-cluster-containing hydrogenase component 2